MTQVRKPGGNGTVAR